MTYRIIFHQGKDNDKGRSDDEIYTDLQNSAGVAINDNDKGRFDEQMAKSQRAMSILPYGENPSSNLKGWKEEPQAEEIAGAEKVVYHDLDCGNQDPYIWHERFLHSMCKVKNNSYDSRKQMHLNVYYENGAKAILPGVSRLSRKWTFRPLALRVNR
ncbi:hypothetical protein EG832_02520, partial [bacterium]|nr:hypothetical protein [bacterium]